MRDTSRLRQTGTTTATEALVVAVQQLERPEHNPLDPALRG